MTFLHPDEHLVGKAIGFLRAEAQALNAEVQMLSMSACILVSVFWAPRKSL